MHDNNEALLVSIPTAARLLSISRSTVYRLLDAGRLSAVKLDQRRLIKVASIRALAESGVDGEA